MVEIMESSFVVPSEETPRGKLWLSNLDQVAPTLYTCTLYFYRNNEARDFFSIEVLKSALAKALTIFYPLAGRLAVSEDGRRVVDCNAEGTLLVVARSELSSGSVNFKPSPTLRSLFVPSVVSPSLMLMLQITYLKCGGVVLGSATNHVLVDGRSAFHFFETWASIARGDLNIVILPSFDHAPLHARSSPAVTFDHPEYECGEVKDAVTPISQVTTKFKLSKSQISSLKTRCSEGSIITRVSTFCVVSALVWKCYCIAKELPPGIEARLMFTADIRERLRPPLPEKFFGNAVIRRSATSEVSTLTSNPIHVAVKAVKAAIDGVTDEFIRSFIDYVEEARGKTLSPIKQLRESDLRIASISGMPVYHANFGWGAPQLMTWAQANGNRVVYIVDEPGNDGGVGVFVSLDSATMQQFEKAFYEELCFYNQES